MRGLDQIYLKKRFLSANYLILCRVYEKVYCASVIRCAVLFIYCTCVFTSCVGVQRDLGIPDLQSYFNEEDEDRKGNFDTEFTQFKVCIQLP